MKPALLKQLAACSAVSLLGLAAAHAQTPFEYPFAGANGFNAPVAVDDLLTNATFTTTGNFSNGFGEGTSNPAVLQNGIFSIRDTDGLNQLLVPNEGASVTFTLASPSVVTMISSYGGWQDSGRDHQSFTIEYADADLLGVFLPVATVDFEPSNADGNISASRVETATNLVNVGALRFTFTAPQENGFVGYGEIDVVPEPATATLAVLSGLALLARRRRASRA